MMTVWMMGEESAYFPSGPYITNPVHIFNPAHHVLPSMPEIVPPASRTMICADAISQGCRLRSRSPSRSLGAGSGRYI
jgi:hypothetical protein